MSSPGQGRRILREVVPVDQVARWDSLRFQYPEASYTPDRGWFTGALRDADEVLRAPSLEQMINRLLAREGITGPCGD